MPALLGGQPTNGGRPVGLVLSLDPCGQLWGEAPKGSRGPEAPIIAKRKLLRLFCLMIVSDVILSNRLLHIKLYDLG